LTSLNLKKLFRLRKNKNFTIFDFRDYGFDIAAGTRPKNIESRIGSIKFYFVNVDNYVNS